MTYLSTQNFAMFIEVHSILAGACSGRIASYLDGTEVTRILREKNWLFHKYCVPDPPI